MFSRFEARWCDFSITGCSGSSFQQRGADCESCHAGGAWSWDIANDVAFVVRKGGWHENRVRIAEKVRVYSFGSRSLHLFIGDMTCFFVGVFLLGYGFHFFCFVSLVSSTCSACWFLCLFPCSFVLVISRCYLVLPMLEPYTISGYKTLQPVGWRSPVIVSTLLVPCEATCLPASLFDEVYIP